MSTIYPIAGLRVGATQAHIRYPNRKDLVLFEFIANTAVAGVFTQNIFCAAPVLVCKQHLAQQKGIRGLVINTGNANAATGESGLVDAYAMAQAAANILQVEAAQVLPFSTGVIGEPLPLEPIIKGLPQAFCNLETNNWEDAAQGIMTTDTQTKIASEQFQINGKTINITGIAKGAGMIQPNMATMLSFIATDAKIEQSLLEKALKTGANLSFNSITVDSDTSTNDSCILIATGASNVEITEQNYAEFLQVLTKIMINLAQKIVKDGEGATKFITVQIVNGSSSELCKTIGLSVANSPLIKTALFASDPNWGRIIMAIGKTNLSDIKTHLLNIDINGVRIVSNGARDPHYIEAMGAEALKPKDIEIIINLNIGSAKHTVWTCDFSYEYVKINADYRS